MANAEPRLLSNANLLDRVAVAASNAVRTLDSRYEHAWYREPRFGRDRYVHLDLFLGDWDNPQRGRAEFRCPRDFVEQSPPGALEIAIRDEFVRMRLDVIEHNLRGGGGR